MNRLGRWLSVGVTVLAAGLVGLLVAASAILSGAAADEEDQRKTLRRAAFTSDDPCEREDDGVEAGSSTDSSSQGEQRDGKWTAGQREHAATITAVAKQRDLPARAAQIAVATAIQESRLRNLTWGDRDSLGLFQQRPSQGWGSAARVRDPQHAAGQFYDRLVKVNGWQQMPLTQAAQQVQRSGFPDAYAQWEKAAKKLVTSAWKDAELPDAEAGSDDTEQEAPVECPPDEDEEKADDDGSAGGSSKAGARAKRALSVARDQIGTPYVWGGGGPNGATQGGFDCSGLTVYAIYQATDGKTTLPRTSQTQRSAGTQVSENEMKPGDLIVFDNDGNWGHVGIYSGSDRMVHAPRTGKNVEEVSLKSWRQHDWEVRRVL